jgi:hypothetical protein
MIGKIVKQLDWKKDFSAREDPPYRLGTAPEARIGARAFLRGQHHGSPERLQRSTRICTGKGVEYVIVGVYTLRFHGVPCYARDMDVFVGLNASESNRRRMGHATGKMIWGRDSGYSW